MLTQKETLGKKRLEKKHKNIMQKSRARHLVWLYNLINENIYK